MKKLAIIAVLFVGLLAVWTVMAMAEETKGAKEAEKVAHEYVGAAKCKVCHKPQYTAWAETGHAKAFEGLSAEEKKKAECTGCHVTGTTADTTLLEGVQCEACHGPGSDYKSPTIKSKKKWAEDREAQKKLAIEAGLIYPKEENCTRCHKKEGNPNFKPFDFAKSKPLVHPVAAEKPME
ncbi:MAG TPA: multiheme c-type cytochrome [Acidobacteriota bacterium]|nr:multiheme c-type cytochrome [Acidobacteriota bacterium]